MQAVLVLVGHVDLSLPLLYKVLKHQEFLCQKKGQSSPNIPKDHYKVLLQLHKNIKQLSAVYLMYE